MGATPLLLSVYVCVWGGVGVEEGGREMRGGGQGLGEGHNQKGSDDNENSNNEICIYNHIKIY